ncbi:scaffold protein salvador [Echinococcus multilocularis]|uniref:Scaffold protein salvador n=1 Tax=Echinococcus multilocularis TaxID=6211 RepID=A0A068XXN5_ECHMU|nr:scaffold protein salvador [Echinococcus multilocularis]
MSRQDSHLFSSKSSGASSVLRPSKLPIFGRRTSEKHPPPTSLTPVSSTVTTSSLGRVRPSTVVRPFFAAQYQPTANNDAQRRRYPASQPSTPVRGGQHETNQEFQQLHRSAHFLRSGGTSGSTTPKRGDIIGAIPQSISFPGSRHALGNQPSKSSKAKSYRMENMSFEHLQYLERRLQQLLEVTSFRPVLSAKAKSDSGRQSTHPSWASSTHHHHHHQHQALHYPVVATPLHYHPHTTPLLLFPQQSIPQPLPTPSLPPPASQLLPPHPTVSGPNFGDIDPYYLSSPSSASSCYAGSSPSSLQDFNRDELICLLHAVRNMLSMHQQSQQSSTSPLDPLSMLQHRPFSWYLHRTADTTAASSPASSTINLFLDEDDSVNVEAMDDGGIVVTDDSKEEESRGRKNSASEGGPHPPHLPPGFRNFSRYLDSKFGPDSTEEQRSRQHHRHQRRRHREVNDNNTTASVVATTSSSGGNRGRSDTDVRPKISITTCSGGTGPYSDLAPSPHESFLKTTTPNPTSGEDNEIAHRLAPAWCAPYWCPPPPLNSGQPTSWYHHAAPPPPPPLPPPPPPLPPPQVRYFAPQPPPNAAAACWFRAAANHFATAAAIFAADNAAAASVLAAPHQLLPPFPHPSDPTFVDRTREHRAPASSSSSTVHPQNVPTTSPSNFPSLTLYPPPQFDEGNSIRKGEREEEDEIFLVSDEENQQQGHRQCLRRLPAVEPLQRQLWGRRSDDSGSPLDSTQTDDDGTWALDMLPQDPALILPDQVDFYAQIKDLLELDSNISLPLPTGWAVGVSSSGRRFYVSCTTGDAGNGGGGERSISSRNRARTTTWQHPIIAPRIPLGWERVEMRRGNCVYYRHLLIPHTQRHHPDLWFPTSLKNVEFEQQSWFFDLRKLQESVSNFDKGNSQLIESYVDARDSNEEAHFTALLKQHDVGQLEKLLKHLDCRFFRDLHRMVVAFEVARIRIVRELFVQHIHRTTATTASSPPSAIHGSAEK